MECSFFACLLFLCQTTTAPPEPWILFFLHYSFNPGQIVAVWCQITCSPCQISNLCHCFLLFFCLYGFMHHNIWGHIKSFFASVPADLFILFSAWTGFSIITWNDVDSAQVCFPITLLQLLMVCIFKEYILHKKMREKGGKNSMCHFLKNTKKSSFTPAIGTHPHITSMIYINS